jgi:hypothetical protein
MGLIFEISAAVPALSSNASSPGPVTLILTVIYPVILEKSLELTLLQPTV